VAYLRNMNSIDRGSLRAGDAAHGKVIVETKGACLTVIASTARARARRRT
jgi:hypothetical protein